MHVYETSTFATNAQRNQKAFRIFRQSVRDANRTEALVDVSGTMIPQVQR
jgi:hypothetical protein